MKRWFKIVSAVMVVALLATSLGGASLARGPRNGDADGICDFVDEDGDGICDNFVDEDGDGVCDNALHDGTGYGHGYGDCDGSCDGTQPAPQDGTGSQHGPGRGW